MIKFACRCSHPFAVEDDQAGGVVQCPNCGRLNDVPTLSDLGNIEDGGIYKVDKTRREIAPGTLSSASRAFTRETKDNGGDDIDMRLGLDEFMAIGADEIPLSQKDEVLPGAPKYDPLSGELIAPMDVKPTPGVIDPNSIPMAQPAIAYATGATAKHISPARILLELFQPINVLVMFFIFIALVGAAFLAFALAVIAALFGLQGFVFNIPIFLIWAHYGNVIDEIGVVGSDELPRPLRDLSWVDDIWGPFSRVVFALMTCYWPIFVYGLFARHAGDMGQAIQLLLHLVGSFFFPAVLLTSVTSGSILNLRPDRVLKVIDLSGMSYFVSVATWLVVGTLNAWLLGGPGMIANFVLAKVMRLSAFNNYAVVGLVTLVSIYLTHFFCWHLGLIYRAHHDAFPWVLQRHIKKQRTDTMSQLEAFRAAQRRKEVAELARKNAQRAQQATQVTISNVRRAEDQPSKEIWERVRDTTDDQA